ncbi:MAG: hypothetical protein LBI63_05280 [Candidatus Ancillula sp.]|jgi:hypothetical protein|nr:hypothetical protein [Candidatus Ancillula sp.]
MTKNSTHLDPVKLKMSLTQKVRFASSCAKIAVNYKRQKKAQKLKEINELRKTTGLKRAKSPVLSIVIVALLILVVVFSLNSSYIVNLWNNLTSNHKVADRTISGEIIQTPSTSGSNESSSSSMNSPSLKLSEAVKAALLQHYGVATFSAIKDSNPNDIASHISNILDSGSSQVVVILDLQYSNTNRNNVKNCAVNLLEILKDRLPDLSGIVVATSDNYYTERAKR